MRNKQNGLTLVELLVAISVLAVVAVLGWRGLDSIVRSRIALTSDLEQTRGMQLTFAQLQSDSLHLAAPTILLNRPAIQAKPEQLNLVRTVFGDGQPSRLQVVSYQVKEGVLTRRESAATRDLVELDTMWQAAINNTDVVPIVTLQSGVSTMTMRLWFAGSSGWSVPFMPSATMPTNPVITPVAPTGLEVSLQLQGHSTSLLKVFLLGAL
jgi:general secretion pathway protein J